MTESREMYIPPDLLAKAEADRIARAFERIHETPSEKFERAMQNCRDSATRARQRDVAAGIHEAKMHAVREARKSPLPQIFERVAAGM